MSCHDIGRGMDSVTKVVIKMFDNGELSREAALQLFMALKAGVHWCDGNEYEAVASILDCRCGKCLKNIEEEQQPPDFVYWIRNPSRASWSLTIPYEINNEIKPAYPDFLIIRKDDKSQAGYVIDILEPHNPDFKDNLPKAKGFARYAEAEPKIGRIQLIRKAKNGSKDRFKRLDFSNGEIRQKVLSMRTSDELDHLFDTDGFFE